MSQANKNPICLCGSLHCTTWLCHWSRFGCSWTTYCMLIIVYQTDKRLAESDLCHETNTKQSPLFVFFRKHPSSVGSGYTRLYWRWCQHDDDIIYEKHSTLLALCEGNPPVFGWFPSQRPVMWRLGGFFFVVRLNNLLNKQWSCPWFQVQWRVRRCNGIWTRCGGLGTQVAQVAIEHFKSLRFIRKSGAMGLGYSHLTFKWMVLTWRKW